jgi:amino acid transporter
VLNVSTEDVMALTAVAALGSAFGMVFGYAKLLRAMADSGLLPAVLRHRHGEAQTALVASIAGSVVSYAICLVAFYEDSMYLVLFNLLSLAAFVCYIAQCIGFIMLRLKMGHVKREFRSVCGIPGAVYSIIVFCVGIVSLVAFQPTYATVVMFVLFCGVASVHYRFVQSAQTFSQEEKDLLFVVHVETRE